MTAKVEKIVKTYKSLAQIPTVLGANIRSNGIISTKWSQRNLEKGKSTKFMRDIFTSDLKKLAESLPVEISSELLARNSVSEKFKAVLRETDNKQFLEIWQDHNVMRTVDLTALDVHGTVYSDLDFSSFEWSPDEKKVLYVVEKKQPKSEPFYKRKGPSSNDGGNGDEEKVQGAEHNYLQDWGEQLVGRKSSVIAEYDIETDTVEVLKGIPDDVCIAQPKYSPDGSFIIGVAYKVEPRKLGLIYCTNRPSTIFKLDFNGNFTQLNLKDIAVKSPIFTPDKRSVVWLQRKAGGPHCAGMALVRTDLPLSENSVPKVVVGIVEHTEKIINGWKTFYGLYNTGFSVRPWASANRLLLSTNQKSTVNSYVVNVDNGDITELEFEDGSQTILDVFNDVVLAVQRSFFKPDKVVIAKLPTAGSEDSISWQEITPSVVVEGLENSMYKYLDLYAEGESVSCFNAIYLGPTNGNEKSVPLIIWPHGGPHSAFANNFLMEGSMFLSLGYAILLINYRGSIGSGQKSVDFLPGKVGTSDVADCILATDSALKSFSWLNPNALALVGGSHGGFLVAHLSGQYPDKFKAVVARNPVIDIASMSITSDIPDWCYVEAGSEYTQQGEIDNNILAAMRAASPIMHAHKVKAPTLLQIGSKDLRVPPQQGTEYFLRLKANGVITKMNLYDDNHPLGTVPNEFDNIINTLMWIEEHLGRSHQ